eukprot:1159964-Pelagomonas_calceolata.AAC.11
MSRLGSMCVFHRHKSKAATHKHRCSARKLRRTWSRRSADSGSCYRLGSCDAPGTGAQLTVVVSLCRCCSPGQLTSNQRGCATPTCPLHPYPACIEQHALPCLHRHADWSVYPCHGCCHIHVRLGPTFCGP